LPNFTAGKENPKNMLKTQVTGIISFVCANFFVLLIFVTLLTSENIAPQAVFGATISLSVSISVILYVYWTKFGKTEMNELEKINYENELLKKRIEQKDLQERLKNL
jgi:cell shape-determining protein MreC